MKKILFILIVSSLMFSSCTKKESISVSTISQHLEKYNSFNVNVTEKYYYSNTADTIVTDFEVWAVRDDSDTLRKGYIWVDNKYRPYNMIYENGHFFLVIPPKKTTILYSNFSEPLISSTDWIDLFLKPEKLQEIMADSNISIALSDVKYHGKQCTKMEVIFKNHNKKMYEKHTYFIDNKMFVPLWSQLKSYKKDYVYTEELFFNDYEFDKVDIDVLRNLRKKLIVENPLERVANSEVTRLEKLLHVGDTAPLFSGKQYPSGQKVSLPDYLGKKIIIVDFWYTHCPPCVRAMPYLSDLYKKYEDKGIMVLGINSVDNQPRSMGELNNFLSKRELSYPVILTNPSVDIMYKINGYPTMYIIDLEGKIAFVETGFDSKHFKKLKDKIEEMTK